MDEEKARVAVSPGWLEPEDTSTSSLLEIENMSARKLSLNPIERLQYLLHNTIKVGECREWQLRCLPRGYGLVSDGTGDKLVHRVMWELFYDEKIPPKVDVCHKCDNPRCCEITHLYIGSRKENLADARAKGRFPKGESHYHYGVKHPHAKRNQDGNS